MAFQKGKQKTGGRKKGTPNKISQDLRKMLNDLLFHEIDSLPKLLDKMEPKDRAEVIIKLMPYAIPKLKDEENSDPQDSEEGSFIKKVQEQMIFQSTPTDNEGN